MNDAAVLLITFNRPDTTKVVLDAIRKAKPERLYVFNDGPRQGNTKDVEARKEILGLLKTVDWDCKLYQNFAEKNNGCGIGVSSAITWAFQNEEKLIILEDDCVASQPFFVFCNYILEKYKTDQRVWMISGRSQNTDHWLFKKYDYLFSRNSGHCAGWATWKRCWETFDIGGNKWQHFYELGGFRNVFGTKEEGKYFNKLYGRAFNRKNYKTSAWSYQFGLQYYTNNGLTVAPAKNLIKNIGYVGVHSDEKTWLHDLDASEDFKVINDPEFVIPLHEYDYYHYKYHWLKMETSFFSRQYQRALRIIKRYGGKKA